MPTQRVGAGVVNVLEELLALEQHELDRLRWGRVR